MNNPAFLFLFILIVSVAGWKTKNLSVSGSLAAVMTGTAVASAFGWRGLFVLGVFFATSSFWSKFRSADKSDIELKLAKTAKRDWQQVIANGGSAMVFALLYSWTNDISYMAAAFAALAAANGDTWASEIGPLSKGNPVSVKTWRRVEKGTSGAVSWVGTSASFAGAFIIAIFSVGLFQGLGLKAGVLIVFTGFLGSIVDTLLGAFLQVEYQCPRCGLVTEAAVHCGMKCEKTKGAYVVNNEFVNFSASFIAGTVTALLM
ncbi:DUF92 domain-containing protein [Bacillus sp. SCS-153A]|uniref:DUF92 domain-containing protein n=1 Tax=Rossellomorea sedimentorum TaxID=3115294 RepID=UPI0039065B19